MILRAEPPQLYPLPSHDFLSAISTVAPVHGYIAVRIGVHEHVEGVGAAVELWEEGDACRDLSEDGGNLGLDFGLGFLGRG